LIPQQGTGGGAIEDELLARLGDVARDERRGSAALGVGGGAEQGVAEHRAAVLGGRGRAHAPGSRAEDDSRKDRRPCSNHPRRLAPRLGRILDGGNKRSKAAPWLYKAYEAMYWPPLAVSVEPVTKAAPSLARNATES